MKNLISLSVILALSIQLCFASNYYVDASATGANDGSSWTDAYTSLQSALGVAVNGDSVFVAEGTYKPTTGTYRGYYFQIQSGVKVFGGFPSGGSVFSSRDWVNNKTILSGDLSTASAYDNSFHVIYMYNVSNQTTLDGFDITGGYANASYPNNVGGGISLVANYGQTCSPMIRNCAIYDNYAVYGGGISAGAYNSSNVSAVISNNLFYNNTAQTKGAGIYGEGPSGGLYFSISNNTFYNNNVTSGQPGESVNLYANNGGQIVNNIMWGNSYEIYVTGTTPTNSCNFVQGGPYGTVTNPLFTDASNNDFSLQSTSPAIEAGNNAYVVDDYDWEGKRRILNGDLSGTQTVDIGAIEYYVACSEYGTAIYVDASATGLNDGSTWENAYNDLQDALNQLQTCSKDSILVAAGSYYPDEGTGYSNNNRGHSFNIPDGLILMGGYPVGGGSLSQRDPIANTTLLSGDIQQNTTTSDNSYHVVKTSYVTSSTIVDGFKIADGYANSSYSPDGYGGGWYNCGKNIGNSSHVVLRNIEFYNNYGTNGGAIFNDASSYGTANMDISNCKFHENRSNYGGAIYSWSPQTTAKCEVTITNSVFYHNTAYNRGGALYNHSIGGNSVSNIDIDFCTFVYNLANGGQGSAIYNYYTPSTVKNSIFHLVSNTAFIYSFNNLLSLDRCVTEYFWSMGPKTNVVVGDPLFVNNSSDWSLQLCSPAMELGDPSTSILTDYNDDARPYSGTLPDAGAFEYQDAPFSSSILYVDASASGSGDGSSWANAYTNLQTAISRAQTCGVDSIFVAAGTYYTTTTTTRTVYFQPFSGLKMFGGFPAGGSDFNQRDWVANKTILSGELGNISSTTDNSYHVVYLYNVSSETEIDGFEITKGCCNSSFPHNIGGGILVYANGSTSSPVIRHCAIHSNTGSFGAGIGLETQNGGTIQSLINNNIIYSNTSYTKGGGLYGEGYYGNHQPVVANNTFYGNMANANNIGRSVYYYYNDGGILANNIMWGNSSEMYYYSGTYATMYNNTYQGGAYGNNYSTADPLFVNAATADFRLQAGSPAIESGNNDYVYSDLDFEGNYRLMDGDLNSTKTIDRGAVEYYTDCAEFGSTIYVDASANGNNDGSSWENAFSSLETALSRQATCSRDSVLVAEGTYYPTTGTDRTISFAIPDGLVFMGGFPQGGGTQSQRDPNNFETILSGDIGTQGSSVDNTYHILKTTNVSSSTYIDGFTISGGQADGTGQDQNGAGLFNMSSGASVVSSPEIRNCTFKNNYAGYRGAGIYNTGELASIASPKITSCIFYGNIAGSYGAGIANYTASSTINPEIVNCLFYNNTATYGGAINNSANGGICEADICNCTFTQNSVGTYGTIANYYANPTISNSILWNNSSEIANISSTPTVSNCCVDGGYAGGTSINYYDPEFEDATANNFRLSRNSRYLDWGNASLLPAGISSCLESDSRISDGNADGVSVIDLGAYESPAFEVYNIQKNTCMQTNTITIASNDYSWSYLYLNDQLIMAINPSGNALGDVYAEFFINDGSLRQYDGRYALDRNWALQVQNTSVSNPVHIRLFVTNDELSTIIAADNAFDPTYLLVNKYSGSNENCNLYDNTGTNTLIANTWNTVSGMDGGYYQFSVTSFSEFTIKGLSVNPLPIELLSFKVSEFAGDALLEWITASENNNDHFDIEYSTNGIDFEKIGIVEGSGNSTSELIYSFTHNGLSNGNHYYRLKQVDYDGAFEYSPIEMITIDPSKDDLLVYPNPATDIINIKANDRMIITNIMISDLTGRMAFQQDYGKACSELISIPVNDLAPGTYIIKVQTLTDLIYSKIIIER